MARIKTKNAARQKNHSLKIPIITFSVLILLIIIYIFLIKPYKISLARDYLQQGDQRLLKNEYLVALVDYQKALWLDERSGAQDRIDLVNKIQLDYTQSKSFLREHNDSASLEALDQAEAVPASIKIGVEQVRDYLNGNQPYLAEIMSQSLVEMDSENNDVWLYLGISRLQSARIMQMTETNRREKLASAKEAFNQATNIDNSDSLTAKYLDEINKML